MAPWNTATSPTDAPTTPSDIWSNRRLDAGRAGRIPNRGSAELSKRTQQDADEANLPTPVRPRPAIARSIPANRGDERDGTADQPASSVLLIEDDPNLLDLYDQILARSDLYDVTTAADGREGLELLDETTDIVVMDWKLPRISGNTLVNRIRDDHPELPLVVISGLDPANRFDAHSIDEVVRKPISADELEDLVQTHLPNRAVHESAA